MFYVYVHVHRILRHVHVQGQTLPQLLPVGEEADPGVGSEQDIDDEDADFEPSKRDHEGDQLQHKAHGNQYYDRDHEVGLLFLHSVVADHGSQDPQDDHDHTSVEALIRVSELPKIIVVLHHHHLGLDHNNGNQLENLNNYNDPSEDDGRILEGAAIKLFSLDHCQITLSETE